MDEDFFSDDDLDLNNDTLQELEQHAISSTQAPAATQHGHAPAPFNPPRPRGAAQPPPTRRQAHNASSLNRAGINRNPQYRAPASTRSPSLSVRPQSAIQKAPSAPPPSAPEPPSSDYGLDDEEVIDLDEPSMVIQPASGLAHRPYPVQGIQADDDLEPSTAAAFAAADAELGSQTFGRWPRAQPTRSQPPQGSSMDVSALQARIAELEAEQARLKHAEQQAREEARQKQGEISIVRSNQEKLTRQYESRISVMQKLHADEASKQKAELEAQRKEREKTETDNRFLHHDLAQEADRARRVNGTAKSRVGTQMGTPRKNKRAGLGDGFDDDEVRLMSPSRSKDKTRDSTPKVGAKRKRPANDSPVAALSFNQQRPLNIRHESSEQTTLSESAPAEAAVAKKDGRYDYIQLLLNHRPCEGHARTVESLAKYSFPSRPDQSLSSIFLDKMTYAADDVDERGLPLKVSQILLDLWKSCTDDFSLQTFAPFYLILDMLRFVLRTELAATTSHLLEEALQLCIRSIEQVSVPIARAATNPHFASNMDRKFIDELADLIDVDEVLDFLHDVCQAATLSTPRIEAFWQKMDHPWMLNLLHKSLPASQITTMLNILKTSAFLNTFGVIIPDDPEKQGEQERQIVERLTNMLFEVPTPWDEEEPPYTEAELTELRILVLEIFHEMCQSAHGGLLLAQHRSVIGRLVRFLNMQINKLYLVASFSDNDETHALQIRSINLSVRILYHILSSHGDEFDVVPKLRIVLGGYHKFLISMTRVAFSDCLIFEKGIEEVVMEAAHGILDYVLGPEEGEMVMRAVETPRGSRPAVVNAETGLSGQEVEMEDR